MTRIVVVQHTDGSGPGRLPEWFAERGVDVTTERAADLVEKVTDGWGGADGVVLLGGGLLPDDDERFPFLPRERAHLSAAVEAGLPVLGICLGAQLLAHVAGGEVTARSGETERGSIGVRLLATAADDRLLGPLAAEDELRMIANHVDSITRLPSAAVHLATSDACAVQAFRLGDAAWGLQFHPEAPASRVAEWDEAAFVAAGFDRDALVAHATADDAVNRRQARLLVDSFVDIVEARR